MSSCMYDETATVCAFTVTVGETQYFRARKVAVDTLPTKTTTLAQIIPIMDVRGK